MTKLYNLRPYIEADRARISEDMIQKQYLKKYLNESIRFKILKFLDLMVSKLYVLEYECNEIVGVGVIRKKIDIRSLRKKYWLYGILIVENQRGKGLGSILISELLNVLGSQNILEVCLKVDDNNFKAISLYKKFDFREIKRSSNQIIMCRKSLLS